jgi:hypothetical protein
MMIGTLDIIKIIQTVLPLILQLFDKDDTTNSYVENSNPTKADTSTFAKNFNENLKEFKLYGGDQKIFAKLNDVPEVTDSDSARKAASIFRDLAIDFKYNPEYPGLSDTFSKQADALDKAAVSYSTTI